jgi:hypothetical protein
MGLGRRRPASGVDDGSQPGTVASRAGVVGSGEGRVRGGGRVRGKSGGRGGKGESTGGAGARVDVVRTDGRSQTGGVARELRATGFVSVG